MKECVAVYGSLRKGLHNHRVLGTQRKCLGKGTVKGFGMYSLGAYPALCVEGKHTEVVVELYEVGQSTMSDLDHLEGYPSYYNRCKVKVETEGGVAAAWVYYMAGTLDDEFVDGGDWVEYLESKL